VTHYRFLEPLDVLFLRGNKLFGDPGSYGESLVPPWPSVAAGAIRSRMLADAGVDLVAFARGEIIHPTLGTPQTPGSFAVADFHLARRRADGSVEALMQPPADLVIGEDASGKITVLALSPISLTPAPLPGGEGRKQPGGDGIQSSAPLPLLPVLAETKRSKPASGWWLSEPGWRKYLAGETPQAADMVRSSELWAFDHRVGVGLDAATRRAADGRLFSVQAVAMRPGVGFLAAIIGAEPPKSGTVRLGGDGRAAAIRTATATLPEADFDAIARTGRCRLILATPGLFTGGWVPTGITQQADGSHHFDLHGVKGRLVCAAVPRAEVISGWDLAALNGKGQPKPAQRAAPTGSVYWLELEKGISAEALRKLADQGLWSDPCEDAARRAEGFNRVWLATWK